MIRFIHTADNHLGSLFKGLGQKHGTLAKELRLAPRHAFSRIVDRAIEEKVDAVLISGDLFDQETQQLGEWIFLQEQMQRLDQAGIYALIIAGNHDYDWRLKEVLEWPEHTFFFPNEASVFELRTRDGERVGIAGYSYNSRWVKERMLCAYPQRMNHVDYMIGLYHGSLEGEESDEGVYAPFSLKELASKHYDYWALGHIHKAQLVSQHPLALYSGNTQGNKRKEEGEKGALLVTLEKGKEPDYDFFACQEWRWQTVTIAEKSYQSLQEIQEAVQEVLDFSLGKQLLSLEFRVSPLFHDTLPFLIEEGELWLRDWLWQYSNETMFLYRWSWISDEPLDLFQNYPMIAQDLKDSYQEMIAQENFSAQLENCIYTGKLPHYFRECIADDDFQEEVKAQITKELRGFNYVD